MENPLPDSHGDQTGVPAKLSEGTRRRSFARRTMRFLLLAIPAIIALLALVWIFENWRGRRAWEAHKREWEAKGERFDLASFQPKPVPPEQNFAATPFLAPLMEFDVQQGQVRWRDPDAVRRIKSVALGRDAAQWLGSWLKAEFTDLAAAADELDMDADVPPADGGDSPPARRILKALERHQPVFAELRQAKDRPEAVWTNRIDGITSGGVERFGILKALNQVAVLRALAELEDGRTDEALADVEVALRFSDTLRSEPLLITYLVRAALVRGALLPVWEGLARHRWTDDHLKRLDETLASIRFLHEYEFAMRGERAFSVESMAQVRSGKFPGEPASQPGSRRIFLPSGMFFQNQVAICRMFQEAILPSVDAANHRVDPAKSREDALKTILPRRMPYNMFAWLLYPAIQKSAQQAALAQCGVDLARTACALERYRLANGSYPESLQALVPRFIDRLPPDLINGEPLKYVRHPDATFVLYSVGWNGTDEGGEVAMRPDGGVSAPKGDWAWRYPSP
ncbi:MAG: hypothetical protein AB9869_28990 [Verrucomicrobiia bacterium]